MSDKRKCRVEIDVDLYHQVEFHILQNRFKTEDRIASIVWGEWRQGDAVGKDGSRFRAWIRDGVEE